MAKITRTWWGERFLTVLEDSMDEGRLKRGRAYAGPHRLLSFDIAGSKVSATVLGNANPYFGVYEAPKYKTQVQLAPFSDKQWASLIDAISENAACLSQLMLGEMPNQIEAIFAKQSLQLLPKKPSDLISQCSCPDYASPCKHVAGVYYKMASLLDRNPLLLFQLRGMDVEKLQAKLAQSPLGQALLDQMTDQKVPVVYQTHRYSAPISRSTPVCSSFEMGDLKDFWQGAHPLPVMDMPVQTQAASVLIKKAGDYPAFWSRDNSFISAMEEAYELIVKKNKAVF
ncbi:SWIM zinc finger family protein [Thiomicrospira microaerophila]|uniref:SWIM zinc finger family protein n=1 Tax=Thiomicrospira microaerophila TaxID=406020 RepID=UPI0005CA1F8D|nr:SWIM zinc finger family protein [Thiomicrospira microaerophila]